MGTFDRSTNFASVMEGRRASEAVAANKTLDAGDSGVEQQVTASGKVITLPATAVGLSYRIVVAGDGLTVNISPAALDQIIGNGFTAADGKDAICTGGQIGDCLELMGDGASGWYCTKVVGTWTREG